MVSKKRNIIAVGGGEIGRPGTKIETLTIDKNIISLSDKATPNVLFISTASSDSQGYIDVVENYFGKKLKCAVRSLRLLNALSKAEVEKQITWADIIYVGGGNTLKMMTLWRKLGVDKLLISAANKGTVLSGVSAGAICWFRYGNSDSRKFTSNSSQLIRVSGLRVVDLLFCPHYDVETSRQKDLKRMMKNTPGVAVACENCTALKIVGNEYEILRSKPSAKAYKCYWTNGKYIKTELNSGLVKELISKA